MAISNCSSKPKTCRAGENPSPPVDRAFGPYFDGYAHVYADPFESYRVLWQGLDGSPDEWLRKQDSPDLVEAGLATTKLVHATRSAFEIRPFDHATGEGLLEKDVLALLDQFIDYCVKKKTTPESSATSSEPTGRTSSACGPTTRPSSASG